jgi:hypothetical protein
MYIFLSLAKEYAFVYLLDENQQTLSALKLLIHPIPVFLLHLISRNCGVQQVARNIIVAWSALLLSILKDQDSKLGSEAGYPEIFVVLPSPSRKIKNIVTCQRITRQRGEKHLA